MKAVYFIVSAMATLDFAAPNVNINAANEAIRAAEIEKRQTSGCGPCKNGQKTSYYCPLVTARTLSRSAECFKARRTVLMRKWIF